MYLETLQVRRGQVFGAQGHSGDAVFPSVIRMMASGRMDMTQMITARYDLTFPVGLSRLLVDEFRRRDIEHNLTVLPCGHYSTGVSPFKWLDGLVLCRFVSRHL